MIKENTKGKIIAYATTLILKKGYNAMSYADISTELNIKNAAVHYHFPTKEDLAIAVLKDQQEGLKNLINDLKLRNVGELEQIKVLFSIYLGLFENGQICALSSMGTDYNTLSALVQIEIKKDYEQAVKWLHDLLVLGKEKGIFKSKIAPAINAKIILNSLIGLVIEARFNQAEKTHLEEIMQQLLENLKA